MRFGIMTGRLFMNILTATWDGVSGEAAILCTPCKYWLEEFHFDGLRMDAVSNLIYWQGDTARGENRNGIGFLQEMNRGLKNLHPEALLIAEDSSAYPGVTKAVTDGGLGFDYKWDMGWMNDTLSYFQAPPAERKQRYHQLTFSMQYFYKERYLLPLSHDEVVHGKATILQKMYGDYEGKFPQARALYLYMFAHPGKKLLFMGAEIGQWHEWDSDGQLDWYLLDRPENQKLRKFFREINAFYKKTAALWEVDFDWAGFEWLVPDDNHNNVVVFLRRDKKGRDLMCAVNFSPNTYTNYRMGVPPHRRYVPVFNTDDPAYGGDGFGDSEAVMVEAVPSHGKECSAAIRIPAFGAVFLRGEGTFPRPRKKQQAKELEKT